MKAVQTWQWMIILVVFRIGLEFTPFFEAHDLFGLVVTTFVLVMIWSQLNYREALLRPFLIGVVIYWAGYLFDYLDGMKQGHGRLGQMADIGDELFSAIGFFLIGLAFLRVMNERNQLIDQLEKENERSLQLQQTLHRQAYTDELTGLGNRRALFDCLDVKLKDGESGTLLYIDVNNFKPVNDRFGHDVGDLVLKRCASKLVQQGALAFRLGGDEFVALLQTQDPRVWALELSKVAKSLAQEYGVSFSIGMASFSPAQKISPDELISQADQAMYGEKVASKVRTR